jgi:hypothetical protein
MKKNPEILEINGKYSLRKSHVKIFFVKIKLELRPDSALLLTFKF